MERPSRYQCRGTRRGSLSRGKLLQLACCGYLREGAFVGAGEGIELRGVMEDKRSRNLVLIFAEYIDTELTALK